MLRTSFLYALGVYTKWVLLLMYYVTVDLTYFDPTLNLKIRKRLGLFFIVWINFFLIFKKYLFIYLAASGPSCGMQDPRCGTRDPSLRRAGSPLWHVGFSLVAARAIELAGSVVAARGLSLWCVGSRARGLSCTTACGILAPQPEIKPTPPALEGKVLTTGPPGKSLGLISFKRSNPYS